MNKNLIIAGIAIAAAGIGVTAIATTGSMSRDITDTAQVSVPARTIALTAMPVGTVTFVRDHGRYDVQVNAYGFTPNSSHMVEVDRPGSPAPEVRLAPITANSVGQVNTTSMGIDTIGRLAYGSRFVIRLGNNTNDFNRTALGAEAIADTYVLPVNPAGQTYTLQPLTEDTNLVSLGTLTGTAKLAFNATAKTYTITVNATGLAPNSHHAAHIHVGSCRNQGPVNMKFMFDDLIADAHGNIVNQTRVITGVTAPPLANSYLNIHLGDKNSILTSAGTPAASFRPLLCGNL